MTRASGYERQADDFYREPAWAVTALLNAVPFQGPVLDPACGSGTIPLMCIAHGLQAQGSDLVDRGYGVFHLDFLSPDYPFRSDNIISNPPYRHIRRFVDLALERTTDRVAVLARLAFLEGRDRRAWFESVPLDQVIVSSPRLSMPPGDEPSIKASGGSVAFAWFVFRHGRRPGAATVSWFDREP